MLELIAKRLDNLESKKYFPSPECEQKLRIKADREISAAACVVAQAAESADKASKSAIAAAAACKSVMADTIKFTAMQRETTSTQNTLRAHTAIRDDAPQPAPKTTSCTASPERIRTYYDVRSSGQYPNISVPSCVATTRVPDTKYPITDYRSLDRKDCWVAVFKVAASKIFFHVLRF